MEIKQRIINCMWESEFDRCYMSENMNCNLEKDKGLVIIGNGFDLYHNLPTRFSDFFELTDNFEKIVTSLPHGIRYKQNNYDVGQIKFDNNSSDLISAFIDFMGKATFSERQICIFRQYIKKNSKYENRLFEYFKFLKGICSKNGNTNWCDFEMNIDELLHIIKDYFSNNMNYTLHQKFKEGTRLYKLKYKKIIELYIDSITSRHNLDIDDLEERVVDEIFADFKKFKLAFAIYIDEFINQMKVDIYSSQLKELKNYYYLYALSFNYTDYSHFNTFFCELENFKYIHGYSCEFVRNNMDIDKYYKNGVVIGIPDDSFDDSKYLEFHKFFQRTMYHNSSISDYYLDGF